MLNISGIQEGFVLDHIQAGMSLQIYHDLKLDQLDCTVGLRNLSFKITKSWSSHPKFSLAYRLNCSVGVIYSP